MNTIKQNRKRNRRIFFLTMAIILVILIAFNMQDVLQGLRDGARDAGLTY